MCQAMKPSDEPINEPSNLVMRVAVCAKDEDEDEDEDSSHSPGTGSAPVGFRQFMNWASNTECSS